MPATITRKPRKKRTPPRFETVADALASLGDIPPERVRLHPYPGTATKRDLLRLHDGGRGLFELVDGTLVEKSMGAPESRVEIELIWLFRSYLAEHPLGFLYSPSALIEIMPNLVRGPDVSFVPWTKQPSRTVPGEPISHLIPDLVVEVLSEGNRPKEMKRKLNEYCRSGVRVIWTIDPRKRVAEVYTSPTSKTVIEENGTLDGGDVLPGLLIPLASLFRQLGPKKSPKRKKK